jgi:hypothetical protein
MNQFNLNVNVNVDLSEDTKAFLKNLLGVSAAPAVQASKPAVSAPAAAQVASASKPVASTVTKPTAPVVSKAEAAPATTTAPAATAATIGIEQVREVLKNKVNTHREAIKAKLDELGAPSVTKLDPSLYTELYNFLQSLA